MADTNQKTAEELEAEKLAAEKEALRLETEAEEEAARKAAASKSQTQEQKDADMVAKLVKERVEQELAGIKSKLDKAYQARDEALSKIEEFNKKERDAELKRLDEEGKHKEAFEIRLAEEKAKREALERENMGLSRDVAVRDALKSYVFRTDKAAEMAFREITSNLIRNEQGVWIHRSGISIKDYCDAFSKDEEQSFLFKAKVSSGGGSGGGNNNNNVDSGKPKSLFKMSQAEVLKLAGEGKLGKK